LLAGSGTISVKKSGKLIRCRATFDNGRIKSIRITGDFFLYPEDRLSALELSLSGATPESAEIVVKQFFREVEAIGISAGDVIDLIREELCHS
jgi:hypothetical protein